MQIPSKSTLAHQLQQAWRWCLTTYHGRVVTLGLIGGLIYLPTYASVLWDKTASGGSAIVLNFGFLYLGLATLWANRQELQATKVLMDDRLIGHVLIVAGTLWIPFTVHSISLQAFLWMMVLIGIAWSSFTPRIFSQFPLPSAFILIGVYPDLVWFAGLIFQFLVGPNKLEQWMAQLGSRALNIMGYAAVPEGAFITLPEGSVEVAAGCTGFDMAIVLAGVSVIWGLLIKSRWHRILVASVTGSAIALIFNIPRIVLLAFAAVYWGEESFDFWHGFWGGQIFSAIMFTAYYYAAMAIFNAPESRSTASRP